MTKERMSEARVSELKALSEMQLARTPPAIYELIEALQAERAYAKELATRRNQ